jgi:hypothetical protein
MGKESREWQSGYGETQAHHVCISPQEDCGGAAARWAKVKAQQEKAA